MRSERNKTIDISTEEGAAYLKRCEMPALPLRAEDLTDRTICADAFEVLPKLPEKSVDLLIADPPYNLSKTYGNSPFRRMPADEYREFTARWLDLVKPILKDDASLYVCCDWRSGMLIGPLLEERFRLRSRITWQREKGRGALQNWKNGMEDIWFATVSDDYSFHLDDVRQRRRILAPYRQDGMPKDWEETDEGRFRDSCPSNFWDDITVPYWSMAENTAHPAQKPEKLLAKMILASSDPEDLVLDPFLGSGSTSVTAAKLGRHYLGIEREPQYCVWAEKRLEMAAEDPSIQGYENGVFWERNTELWRRQKRGRKK